MAKKKTAIDFVLAANATAKVGGQKNWLSRLPDEGKKEMAEIKKEWTSGCLKGIQCVVVFRGIVARCEEESWQPPKSETTILRWLRSSEK